ncbi:MAG: NADP-dependent oxidoreductase [Gemmatimonadaceae bacterium]|nr:NADP-dependent oxidoreductase [Acetobacteraceae bacterium]
MAGLNRRIVLARRPAGTPQNEDFRLEETARPVPGPGQVLVRTIWLSLDPYMRGRMNDAPSYAPAVAIGDVMVGGTVSEVVESHAEGLSPGDLVEGRTGWQHYAAVDAAGLRLVARGPMPPSTALGVLGMPGMTAYCGMQNIGQPKPGETVVVGAASGPVGSLVGQIARLRGARAVGIAGGPEKCAYVRDLGFDDCVDHRAPDLSARLAAACPGGIDVYFENVGGAVWDAVLPLLNPFARIPVCGLVAHANQTSPPQGPDRSAALMRAVLTKRLLIRGFIVWDFSDQEAEFLGTVGAWIANGQVRYREDVVDGLENAASAFIGMLRGANFGKLLVRVGADPAPA